MRSIDVRGVIYANHIIEHPWSGAAPIWWLARRLHAKMNRHIPPENRFLIFHPRPRSLFQPIAQTLRAARWPDEVTDRQYVGCD